MEGDILESWHSSFMELTAIRCRNDRNDKMAYSASCCSGMTVIANTTSQEEKIKLQKIICTQNRRADMIVSVAGGKNISFVEEIL